MKAGQCSYCGALRRMTRDHIIPKSAGGQMCLPCGTKNWRLACLECNQQRAIAGHCVAALRIAQGMAYDTGLRMKAILAAMGYAGSASKQQHWRRHLLGGAL